MLDGEALIPVGAVGISSTLTVNEELALLPHVLLGVTVIVPGEAVAPIDTVILSVVLVPVKPPGRFQV